MFYSMSLGSCGLHSGTSMAGCDMSVTRTTMMSVPVTELSQPSLFMLDDLGMTVSASKAAPSTAYSNNVNISQEFINSMVLFVVY